MGKYEDLAFELISSAFGDRFVRADSRIFSFGPGGGEGSVDGVNDGRIAVEIGDGGESRSVRPYSIWPSTHCP
jgi:hypothetical protein